MDFALSAKAQEHCDRMWDFMREEVFPAEPVWAEQRKGIPMSALGECLQGRVDAACAPRHRSHHQVTVRSSLP